MFPSEQITQFIPLNYNSSEKAVQDGFTDVMEKLSDSHRVRGSCSLTDSGICRGQVIPRVLYAGQDQD